MRTQLQSLRLFALVVAVVVGSALFGCGEPPRGDVLAKLQ